MDEEQAKREEMTAFEIEQTFDEKDTLKKALFANHGVDKCLGPDVCAKCREEAQQAGWKSYSDEKFPDTARRFVTNYINIHNAFRVGGAHPLPEVQMDDVYVVFFTYILGNWKAMVSTRQLDGMYYEVTHNAAKGETYLDAYQKTNNILITDHVVN